MAANSISSRSAGCRHRKSNSAAWFAAIHLLALSVATPARAQDADVSLKIDVVAWGDEIGGLSFKAGEKNADITALAFRYSKPVLYAGPALMEIFKNGNGHAKEKAAPTADDLKHEGHPLLPEAPKTSAEKDGPAKQGLAQELEKRRKKYPNLVALAPLPGNCRRATVLLAPEAGGTYQAYVIDDDPTKLPPGQLRIHNLSPHTIAMRLNGSPPKEIKTRETLLAAAPNQQLTYDLAYQLGTEWKFQEHNIIPIRAEEQTQMIILRSDNQFFRSSDGSTGGFLQAVTLRRLPKEPAAAPAAAPPR